jgi:ferritin-like protein
MKKIFKSFLIVAVMASVASISSCTKTCDPGYEGTDCKTETRAKVLLRHLYLIW